MHKTAPGGADSSKRATPTSKPRTTTAAAQSANPPRAAGASGEGWNAVEAPEPPAFLHLYDLGRSLIDTGRRTPTRQTLIRRGAEFAARNGLAVYEVGRDRYVSAADVRRLAGWAVAA